jgi:cell division septation protein DedD
MARTAKAIFQVTPTGDGYYRVQLRNELAPSGVTLYIEAEDMESACADGYKKAMTKARKVAKEGGEEPPKQKRKPRAKKKTTKKKKTTTRRKKKADPEPEPEEEDDNDELSDEDLEEDDDDLDLDDDDDIGDMID